MGKKRLKPCGDKVFHHVMTRTAQQVFWLEKPEVKDIFIDLMDFYSQVYFEKSWPTRFYQIMSISAWK